MKIQDYLHYYLGCDYQTSNSQGNVNAKTLPDVIDMCKRDKGVQLHLRRLEDMTEEDKTEIGKMFGWYEGKKIFNEHHLNIAHETTKEMAYDAVVTANENDADRLGPQAYFNIVPYLCRQGYDIFNLIDNGLAVDIKTIQ